jgi:Rrf2 family protein
MKYSSTIAYAIQATVLVAERGADTPISCGQIAHDGGMPERFLLRILSGLVAAKILRSTRGSDGGYSLVRPPNKITLLQVMDAVKARDTSGLQALDRQEASLRREVDFRIEAAFDRAEQAARREIGRYTIQDLMACERRLSHPA